MPIYDYTCGKCHNRIEVIQLGTEQPDCCGVPMHREIGLPALIRIKGKGYPSRRKWTNNWTPDSAPFPPTSSVHGEKR